MNSYSFKDLSFCLSFSFMLLFPNENQELKLLLIILGLICAIIKKQIKSNITLLKWSFIYILCNFIPYMIGLIYNNPGVLYYSNTYFVWPILYTLVFFSVDDNFYWLFHKVMVICTWIVVAIGLIAFFYFNVNLVVDGTFWGIKPTIRPGFPFITISDGCVDSIIFLYSYLIVYSIQNNRYNLTLLVLCFIFIFTTSSRIIYVILFLSVILYLFFEYKVNKNTRNIQKLGTLMLVVLLCCIIVVIATSYMKLFAITDILDFFSEVSEQSDSYRTEQYYALIKGWSAYPLLGNGTGVNAEVVRSTLIPGMYELTYIAILFERGVLGFIVYIGLLLFLSIKSIHLCRCCAVNQRYLFPNLVALNMMLVANITNNYTQCFDYIWMLFILFPLFKKDKNENLYRS